MLNSGGDYAFLKPGFRRWAFFTLAALVLVVALSGCATPVAYADMDYQPLADPGQPVDSELPAEFLQQLVAPIALYPDVLVSQILTASTFPQEVVLAERWLQAHPGLKGEALSQAVEAQSWDPSIKALTAFPAVLGNMDKNLAWTSSLGEAYTRQPENVMTSLQDLRRRARAAGTLVNTPQQTLVALDDQITIEPADEEVVYVPAFDPWEAYGEVLAPWPGWSPYPGIWFGGPYLTFGLGCWPGYGRDYGWGCSHWGMNWAGGCVTWNHNRYDSPGTTFRHHEPWRNPGGALPFGGDTRAARGFAESGVHGNGRTGAFSGYGHRRIARAYDSAGGRIRYGRGSHGGGSAHNGGGFHGGGGHK